LQEDDTGLSFSLDLGSGDEARNVVKEFNAGRVNGISLGLLNTVYEDAALASGLWSKEVVATEVVELSVILAPRLPVHVTTRKHLSLSNDESYGTAERRLLLASVL
jgi:phage head maturation protease